MMCNMKDNMEQYFLKKKILQSSTPIALNKAEPGRILAQKNSKDQLLRYFY